jgi:hypothetical protein
MASAWACFTTFFDAQCCSRSNGTSTGIARDGCSIPATGCSERYRLRGAQSYDRPNVPLPGSAAKPSTAPDGERSSRFCMEPAPNDPGVLGFSLAVLCLSTLSIRQPEWLLPTPSRRFIGNTKPRSSFARRQDQDTISLLGATSTSIKSRPDLAFNYALDDRAGAGPGSDRQKIRGANRTICSDSESATIGRS